MCMRIHHVIYFQKLHNTILFKPYGTPFPEINRKHTKESEFNVAIFFKYLPRLKIYRRNSILLSLRK